MGVCLFCGEMGEIGKEVLLWKEFLEGIIGVGGEVAEEETFCEECEEMVKEAVERRRMQGEVERKVELLQKKLLGELRKLESCVEGYWVIMEGIGRKVTKKREGRGDRRGRMLKKKIIDVVKDLEKWRCQLGRKTRVERGDCELAVITTATDEENSRVENQAVPDDNTPDWADAISFEPRVVLEEMENAGLITPIKIEEDAAMGVDSEPNENPNISPDFDPEEPANDSSSDSGPTDRFPVCSTSSKSKRRRKNSSKRRSRAKVQLSLDHLPRYNRSVVRLCLQRRHLYLEKAKHQTGNPLSLECTYLFNYSSDQLTLHSIPISIPPSTSTLQCSQCLFTTPSNLPPNPVTRSVESIFNHILSVHFSAFQCSSCPRHFKTRKKYNNHIAEHKKNIFCDICQKPFKSSESLPLHKWLHLSAQEKQERLASGTQVPSYWRQKLSSKPVPKPLDHLPCHICHKLFSTPRALKAHEKRHLEDKFICPNCGKSMKQVSYDTYHKFRCGEGNGTWREQQCLHCDKQFASKAGLSIHVMRFHSQEGLERMHRCDQCGRGYKTSFELTFHMKTHSEERPWKCEVCGKSWTMKRNLTRHKCKGMQLKDEVLIY